MHGLYYTSSPSDLRVAALGSQQTEWQSTLPFQILRDAAQRKTAAQCGFLRGTICKESSADLKSCLFLE